MQTQEFVMFASIMFYKVLKYGPKSSIEGNNLGEQVV